MRDDPVDVPLGTPPAKNVRIVFPTYKPGENKHYRLPVNLVTSTPLHSQPVVGLFHLPPLTPLSTKLIVYIITEILVPDSLHLRDGQNNQPGPP